MSHDETSIGKIDTTDETAIVASGGWCAPSGLLYDADSKDTAYAPPTPDPLPKVTDEWTEEQVWVVIDEYGERTEHYDRESALLDFVAEQARSMNYDTVVLREEIKKSRVIAAAHGTKVPRPPTPEEMDRIGKTLSMFPGIPVQRGGITFKRNERETP